jgi:hypothetical protein
MPSSLYFSLRFAASCLALCAALCGCSAGSPRVVDAGSPRAGAAVRAADGMRIGSLGKLDDFPLYELLYEADYDLAKMAATARPDAGEEAFACTCFAAADARGHRVLGRNFDWDRHPILVLLTKPKGAYESISLVDIHYLGYSPSRSPLDDPSDLSGAPGIPFDGMNEKGLAVGMMAVDHAEGPEDPSKPIIGELGLIRVFLDRAATVEEAVALAHDYRIDFGSVPIHYFVADRGGSSAVIEFVGGEVRALHGEGQWQVSTNFIFSELGSRDPASLCWRFAAAAEALRVAGGIAKGRGALDLLERVSQPNTIWSSAYDLVESRLDLSIGRSFGTVYRWRL